MRTIELLEALLADREPPHKALRDWGRKYSVSTGHADDSWWDRMRWCIESEIKRLQAQGVK